MKHKERLDVLLVVRGLAESRQPGRRPSSWRARSM